MRKKKPSGFALLICLVVAAVCSVLVIGIFQTLQTENIESAAVDNEAAADRLARACNERAVALLLQDPSLRGALPPIELPIGSGNSAIANINENGGLITISSSANVKQLTRTHQYSFQISELNQRRSAMSP